MRLDPTHQLARGLQMLLVPAGNGAVIDICKPRAAIGTSSLRARGAGVLNATMAASAIPDCLVTAAPFTVMAHGYLNSATAYQGLFGNSNFVDNSNNQGWVLQTGDPGSVFRGIMLKNNSNYQLTGGTYSVGQWSLAMTGDGTTVRLYQNGAFQNSDVGINQFTAASSAVLQIGQTSGGNGWEFQCGAVWARALSDAEIRRFHYEPLCMVTADNDRMLPAMPPPFGSSRMFFMFPG